MKTLIIFLCVLLSCTHFKTLKLLTYNFYKLCYNLFYFPFSKVIISKFSLVNIPQPRPRVTIAMCNLLNIQVLPTFQKSTLCPVTFMKDLYIVSAFAKRKKSRENFCFYKKGTESEKTAFNICFAALRQWIPWVASANTNPLPQELHSSSQHQAAITLNCLQASVLYLNVYCVSICTMCVQ